MANHPLAPPPPPPPRPPPDRKPPLSATGKPPIKRKNPPTTANSPNKRPNIPPPPPPTASSSVNIQDTATSKPQDDTTDFLHDLYILQTLIDHRTKKGVFPFETPDAMADFMFMWTVLGIGTEDEWKERIEKVKAKYTIESQPVETEEMKEFDLWMRIWGNEGCDEHDPDHGAGAVGSS